MYTYISVLMLCFSPQRAAARARKRKGEQGTWDNRPRRRKGTHKLQVRMLDLESTTLYCVVKNTSAPYWEKWKKKVTHACIWLDCAP